MSHDCDAIADLEAAVALGKGTRSSTPEESALAQQLVNEALLAR